MDICWCPKTSSDARVLGSEDEEMAALFLESLAVLFSPKIAQDHPRSHGYHQLFGVVVAEGILGASATNGLSLVQTNFVLRGWVKWTSAGVQRPFLMQGFLAVRMRKWPETGLESLAVLFSSKIAQDHPRSHGYHELFGVVVAEGILGASATNGLVQTNFVWQLLWGF